MTRPTKIIIPARSVAQFEKWLAAQGFKLIHYGPTRYKYRRPYQWDYGWLRN